VVSLALADELFLITHDLQTGKGKLGEPALGLGLAAALLGELVFAGCVAIDGGRLLLGEYAPPAERLSEVLFTHTREQILGSGTTVRDWLAEHRKLVVDLVADRLVRSGEMRREQHRRLGRTIVRFYPVRPGDAFIQAQRLPSYLRNRVEITMADVVIATLAIVIAPSGGLLELDPVGRDHLDQLVPLLPLPLRELLSITEASVLAALRSPLL
jgi:hypothetical protein